MKVLVFLIITGVAALAGDLSEITGEQALGGLAPRMRISIVYDADAALKSLAPESQLLTVVELELRRSGVVIDSTAGVIVEVTIVGVGVRDGNAFAIALELAALVPVTPTWLEDRYLFAPVWRASEVIYMGRDRVDPGVGNAVRQKAEAFMNAYLKANPRRTAPPPQ